MTTKLDWHKTHFYLCAGIFGIISAIWGQPLIHDNDQAITVIVTAFSILAGFLIAIIAILGDPVMLTPGTWRRAEIESHIAFNRLIRHKWLFLIYLVTLALIFCSFLIKDRCLSIAIWLERIYLFFAVFGFILSLSLPSELMKLQKNRIESYISKRRADAGIKDE